MNAIVNFMEKYIMPVAARIGSQKHLVAVRDAFIAIMPITMAGSIAVLLNVFFRDFPSPGFWDGNVHPFTEAMMPFIRINGIIWTGSLAIIALALSATLGFMLARIWIDDKSGLSHLSGSLVAVAAFVMGAGGNFGPTALFTAMIFSFLSVWIFKSLVNKKITIKMPESVPPAVSRAFVAVIPGFVALYICALVYYMFDRITGYPVLVWINQTIQEPMLGLTQNFGLVLLMVFLVHLLWFFGLHGTNVLGPVFSSTFGVAQLENMAAFESGLPLPYFWTAGSFDAFVWPGGAGVTLALIVAMIFFAKRSDYKAVSKLGVGPGVFNINEPIMFGLPVVLNPIMFIPFLLAPIATAAISYFAFFSGMVNPVAVSIPWPTPVIISGFLATGGDWRSIILSLINVAVAFAIWAPFIIAANKLGDNPDLVK